MLEKITEHQVSRLKTPAPPLYACLFTLILDIDTIVPLAPASLSLGLRFMWHQMANPDRCHNTCVIRPCKPCSVAGAQYWDPTHTSRKVLYNACSVAVLSVRMLTYMCAPAAYQARQQHIRTRRRCQKGLWLMVYKCFSGSFSAMRTVR